MEAVPDCVGPRRSRRSSWEDGEEAEANEGEKRRAMEGLKRENAFDLVFLDPRIRDSLSFPFRAFPSWAFPSRRRGAESGPVPLG